LWLKNPINLSQMRRSFSSSGSIGAVYRSE
jgi:hypothetical protein